MGKRMGNAPVYFTISQVQHNPLLSLESYLPTIQEKMRKAGYPDFKRSVQMAFALTPLASDMGQAGQPTVHKVDRFLFSDVKGTSGFVLLANSLSFQTTEYETFELFSSRLKLGLEILSEAVGGLSFVERLGLRYLDAVVPSDGESLSSYLANELLGLSVRLPESKFAYSFTEALLVTEGLGQVVSRTVLKNGALEFPPDLHPDNLKLLDKFGGISGEHAVIDTDGSLTQRRPFALSDIQDCLNDLHDLIDKTFRATVTDHALAMWRA